MCPQRTAIWAVDFEAKMPAELITEEDLKCPDCGVVHDPSLENARVFADTVTVLAVLMPSVSGSSP